MRTPDAWPTTSQMLASQGWLYGTLSIVEQWGSVPHAKERAWRSESLRNQESRGLAAHYSSPVDNFRTIIQLGQTSRETGKGLTYILLTLVK